MEIYVRQLLNSMGSFCGVFLGAKRPNAKGGLKFLAEPSRKAMTMSVDDVKAVSGVLQL